MNGCSSHSILGFTVVATLNTRKERAAIIESYPHHWDDLEPAAGFTQDQSKDAIRRPSHKAPAAAQQRLNRSPPAELTRELDQCEGIKFAVSLVGGF